MSRFFVIYSWNVIKKLKISKINVEKIDQGKERPGMG